MINKQRKTSNILNILDYDDSGNLIATGSIRATSFTGSFSGSGADLFDIPASGIIGLNLSQISSGSVSASISPNNGLQVNTSTTITGSLTISGSIFNTTLPDSTGSGHVLMYNTSSGQFSYTASSAIGGGGNASNDNFQQLFLLMGG